MLLIFLSALFWLCGSPKQGNPSAKPIVRPCPDSWNKAPHGKDRPSHKKNVSRAESGACIELATSWLDVQEYLQSYARQQRWAITADQIAEDSWIFSLEIGKEELLRDTFAESSLKDIEWTGGTVRVHLNSLQLPDGFARTTVQASFRGFGRNTDQFAVKKEYWELQSSNALENSIVSAFRNRFSQSPTANSALPDPR